MTTGGPSISVVVVACNEAADLDACLASARLLADEIVVIDLESTDSTAQVAARHGARVLSHTRVPYADPIRTWAYQQAQGDWILALDPDERVMPALPGDLRAVAASNDYDVVRVARQPRVLGRELHAPGLQDGTHPRFFRRGSLRWPAEVHSHPDLSGLRVLDMPRDESLRRGAALLHDNWRTPTDIVARIGRYAADEAAARLARGERFSTRRMIGEAGSAFGRRVAGGAHRDGMAGMIAAAFCSMERFVVSAEMWRMQGPDPVSDAQARRVGRPVAAALSWVRPLRRARRLLRGGSAASQ